jgi:hypothetical protein
VTTPPAEALAKAGSGTNQRKSLGDYCGKVHLFPFRTEKLSLPAPMILPHKGGKVGRRQTFKNRLTFSLVRLFLFNNNLSSVLCQNSLVQCQCFYCPISTLIHLLFY